MTTQPLHPSTGEPVTYENSSVDGNPRVTPRNKLYAGAREHFEQLRFDKAWTEQSPGAPGRLVPYLHVPCPHHDCVHRVYRRGWNGEKVRR